MAYLASGRILIAALSLAWLSCGISADVNRAVGARCDSMDECDDRCLPPADYPGGFCTLSCESRGDCSSGTDCVDREGGVCLFRCSEGSDCSFLGPDWSCVSESLRSDPSMEAMVCVPS